MDIWYTENHTDNVRLSFRIDRQLASVQSDFQRIDIFESVEFGRIMTLDGLLMLTEKDEYVYHEMITHIPMATNPGIRNVLVIGAGDGGTVRELCRYPTIEHIDMVEIDEMVVELSKKYLPFTACSLEDPRVNIHIQDGLRFVRRVDRLYDLIIVDSTDPFGVGEGLFTKEFYGNCFRALQEDGILVNQHESTFYTAYANSMKRAHSRIKQFFPIALVYQAHIPTYPSGHWLFGFASKKYHPLNNLRVKEWKKLHIKTRYYTTNLHRGAFMLPKYLEDMLEDEEDR